ncbi:MAG: oxidoreductase aldo reductase [Brevundimonas sp.]|nr:oxidoreductase aldo reductase [Brevundimonas sp.]
MAIDRMLGRSGIAISPIGLGCMQFSQGQGLIGRMMRNLDQTTVNAIVGTSLDGGVNWFDTAELYGGGSSERALAAALLANQKHDGDVVVATKWSPLFRTASSIKATIGARKQPLSPFHIDLHQVHQPLSFSSVESQMDAMADLAAAGDIRAVGVSNFSEKPMRAAHAALAKRGLMLASNQMQYSLLARGIERNGVLAAAKELGITVIAYSPLAQGLLSGKFHDDPGLLKGLGVRGLLPWFSRKNMERSRPLVMALKEIAGALGAAPASVALAWLTNFHGDTVTAIPGATSVAQAASNAAAMQVRLTSDQLQRLDTLSRDLS